MTATSPFAELYDRYGRRLYGLGLRLPGDGALAEELVQDTFVRLWRGAGGFDPARGTVRGLKGYEHLLLGPDLGEAMSSLSQKHREVLELHYHRDLTQQEIADRLNVPMGTVKSRTLYALRALRLECEERGPLA